MVHKKYIKRGGKIFGPYLYQNYRENGVTKTRYLGLCKKEKNKGKIIIFSGLIILLLIILGMNFFEQGVFNYDLEGRLYSENVNILINIIENNPPEIRNILSEILVCENTALDYEFSVYDKEGDDLFVSLSPSDPFYIMQENCFWINDYILNCSIVSGVLNKQYVIDKRVSEMAWAVYPEAISANDGELFSDFETEITIIEVNNAPNITSIPQETVETWIFGDDNIFDYKILASDIEDGTQDDGKLIFNLNFLDAEAFFDISENGGMYFNASGNDDLIGNYSLLVCVEDAGLENEVHEDISLCWNSGGYGVPAGDCKGFILTITDRNRVPNITSYSPINLSFEVSGTDILFFNLTKYDADGNNPDTFWYVDDVEKQFDAGFNSSSFNELRYSFGCGISGTHKIKAVVTDGLANDSVEWNISVNGVACPSPSSPSGGGGSSGKLVCKEKWVCNEWNQCLNLKNNIRRLTKETELMIKERCGLFNWNDDFCGFQLRECEDLKNCGTEFNKTGIIQECYYTENPSCEDNIKNCHRGSCELLVDCGGPCAPCPTCEDGIKNQGEERIDCGGPCKPCVERPLSVILTKSVISFSLIALLILVLILFIKQIIKYSKFKKTAKKIVEKRDEGLKIVRGIPVTKLVFVFAIVVLLVFANSFIIGFSEMSDLGKTVFDANSIGYLSNYGLANFIVSRVGMFFVSGPVLSWDNNAELTIGEESDINLVVSGGDNVFYANYNYFEGSPISIGDCRIRFEDYFGEFSDWENMVYDGTLRFEYTKIFDYKGNYDFEVMCSEDGTFNEGSSQGFVEVSEGFVITNTGPKFVAEAYQTVYFGAEDELLVYNFSSNVSEPDVNDELVFSIVEIKESEAVIDAPWISLNSSTGVMTINSTFDYEAGEFEISVRVLDDEPVGVTEEFHFNIALVNDAPYFIDLDDLTLNEGDLFSQQFAVFDEENDFPLTYDMEILNCVNDAVDCNLFYASAYSTSGDSYFELIFTPRGEYVGEYEINFSVEDSGSELGNQMTSQVVNFTVNANLWNENFEVNYLDLVEDELFNLDLNEGLISPGGDVSFSLGDSEGFPSLAIDENGIINFAPVDADVGFHEIEIFAEDNGVGTISSKVFTFNVTNVPDELVVSLQEGGNVEIDNPNLKINVFENANVEIQLLISDDDLEILQKDYYDEEFVIDLAIQGNDDLFSFVHDAGYPSANLDKYVANFVPCDADVGNYPVTISVSDKSGFSNVLNYDLEVINRDYDDPVINFPDELYVFNLKENISSDLMFSANHTVGDNLEYEFYIDGDLRHSLNYYGDNTTLTWNFAPDFSDETYGERIKNFTLLVKNPILPEFNVSRTWNLTVSHTNAPVEIIDNIDSPITIPYSFAKEINLSDYFLDVDYFDEHYNQSVGFFVSSNASLSDILITPMSDFGFIFSSGKAVSELLNVTVYDIDETGNNLTFATSNYFEVVFTEPEIVPVPVPVPSPSSGGRGSSGSSKIIALKLIVPREIPDVSEYDKVEINLQLINPEKRVSFKDVYLNSSAFKDGDIANEVKTTLDKNYFKSLASGTEENITLTVFFDTEKVGDYEILINLSSKSPKYYDWSKIHINLQKINESKVRERIVFMEEYIVENPVCLETKEILDEAERYFEQGDFVNAKIKTEEAITACNENIAQASMPLPRKNSYTFILYLFVAILVALIIGLISYFIQRRRMQKGLTQNKNI